MGCCHSQNKSKEFDQEFVRTHQSSLVNIIMFNYIQDVKFLITHGYPINTKLVSACNGTLLHVAAKFGKPDMIYLLLSYGANPHLEDGEGKTPMKYALDFEKKENVDVFIKMHSESTGTN